MEKISEFFVQMYQEQFLVVVTKAEPPKRQKRKDPELYEQLSKQRRLVKRADTGKIWHSIKVQTHPAWVGVARYQPTGYIYRTTAKNH